MATVFSFQAGIWQQQGFRWDVPPNPLPATYYFELSFNLAPSGLYSGGETTKTRLMYFVTAKNSSRPAMTTISKDFGSSDFPGPVPHTFKRGRWAIPAADLAGKQAGRIEIYFASLSTSAGPRLYFGEPLGGFRPGPPGYTGFAFA